MKLLTIIHVGTAFICHLLPYISYRNKNSVTNELKHCVSQLVT